MRDSNARWTFSRDGRRVENGGQLEEYFQAYHALKYLALETGIDMHANAEMIKQHVLNTIEDLRQEVNSEFERGAYEGANNPSKYGRKKDD